MGTKAATAACFAALLMVRSTPVLACVGDCGADDAVGINEIIECVNVALGAAALPVCPACSSNGRDVVISDLIEAVRNALTGCAPEPPATSTSAAETPLLTATVTPAESTRTASATTNRNSATVTPTSTPLPGGFTDNGDGTISDPRTGLMWEKKVGRGGGTSSDPHDADLDYSWAGECSLTRTLCQPDPAAATLCAQQSDGVGCSQCAEGAGTCNVRGVATVWAWLSDLNSSSFGGHGDWRIPTMTELFTIVDFSAPDPPTFNVFNRPGCSPSCIDLGNLDCSCTIPEPYWSSTTYARIPTVARTIFFESQFLDSLDSKSFAAAHVRAVRGDAGPSPVPRFIDNGDGTISDQQTGLMWEKKLRASPEVNVHAVDGQYDTFGTCSLTGDLCQPDSEAATTCAQQLQNNHIGCSLCSPGTGTCSTFQDQTIFQWVNGLNLSPGFAGHTDWRIPSITEILTLYDFSSPAGFFILPEFVGEACVKCFDASNPICDCNGSEYATTTSTAQLPLNAWRIHFFGSELLDYESKAQWGFVRAVRTSTN